MIADRWGVTPAEVARAYPCDDLVTCPAFQGWRAITVAAPPETVWPWVTQIRLAPYSYDWIDNLGRRSPQELRDLPEPVVGEPFLSSFGRPLGAIVAVTVGREFTGTILGAVMSYVLVPVDGARRTRLLLKIVRDGGRLLAPLLSVGDLVMARR
jgi:hypothetical protein